MMRPTNDLTVNSGFSLESCFSSLAACIALQEIFLVPASWAQNHTVGSGHTCCTWTRAAVPCTQLPLPALHLCEINKMEMSSLHHHEGEVGIKFQQSMFAATEIDTRSLCYCKA